MFGSPYNLLHYALAPWFLMCNPDMFDSADDFSVWFGAPLEALKGGAGTRTDGGYARLVRWCRVVMEVVMMRFRARGKSLSCAESSSGRQGSVR